MKCQVKQNILCPVACAQLCTAFCLAVCFECVTHWLCCVLRVNTPRKQGGLGNMNIPLLADKTLEISRMYGCLKEDEGIAFR